LFVFAVLACWLIPAAVQSAVRERQGTLDTHKCNRPVWDSEYVIL